VSRSASVIAAVVAILAAVGSVAAIESDPLGVLLAGVLVFAALVLLIVVYTGDALIRTSRKTRAKDKP
jgi:heme A synthase